MAFAGKTSSTVRARLAGVDPTTSASPATGSTATASPVATVRALQYTYSRRSAARTRYTFALEAVDAAGNASNRAEATGSITTAACPRAGVPTPKKPVAEVRARQRAGQGEPLDRPGRRQLRRRRRLRAVTRVGAPAAAFRRPTTPRGAATRSTSRRARIPARDSTAGSKKARLPRGRPRPAQLRADRQRRLEHRRARDPDPGSRQTSTARAPIPTTPSSTPAATSRPSRT